MSVYAEDYEKFRRSLVSEWKLAGRRRCSVRFCGNIPGQDGFPIQVDHVLDRNRFPELIFDRRNTKITCGAHNDIDHTCSGKTPILARLRFIAIWWPDREAFAWEESARRGFVSLSEKPKHRF